MYAVQISITAIAVTVIITKVNNHKEGALKWQFPNGKLQNREEIQDFRTIIRRLALLLSNVRNATAPSRLIRFAPCAVSMTVKK